MSTQFNSLVQDPSHLLRLSEAAESGNQHSADLVAREVGGVVSLLASATDPSRELPESSGTLLNVLRLFPFLVAWLLDKSGLVETGPGVPKVAMQREGFPVGNAEFGAPLPGRLASRVGTELQPVRIAALNVPELLSFRNQAGLPEIALAETARRATPSRIGSTAVLRCQQVLNTCEHIERTGSGPWDPGLTVLLIVTIDWVTLLIEMVLPVTWRRFVNGSFAETDADAPPSSRLVETGNLRTATIELGFHKPLVRSEDVVPTGLDSFQSAIGTPSAADDRSVPGNETCDTPLWVPQLFVRFELGGEASLDSRRLDRILRSKRLGGLCVVVLTAKLILHRLVVRFVLRGTPLTRLKLEGVGQHRSDTLHHRLGEVGLAA